MQRVLGRASRLRRDVSGWCDGEGIGSYLALLSRVQSFGLEPGALGLGLGRCSRARTGAGMERIRKGGWADGDDTYPCRERLRVRVIGSARFDTGPSCAGKARG